jgi:phosphoribosyl 1,2-cyclic phosphodiesterase
MLPQLYKNLLDHGVEDRLMARFAELSRHYSDRNEMLFQKASEVLKAFRDEGYFFHHSKRSRSF